jgi:hypothetical protein
VQDKQERSKSIDSSRAYDIVYKAMSADKIKVKQSKLGQVFDMLSQKLALNLMKFGSSSWVGHYFKNKQGIMDI